jgi:hypothetical protein
MSGLVAIRTAITDRLASVPDVGRVHDWQRPFTTEAELRQHYGWPADAPDAPLRGWYVTLHRITGTPARSGRGRRLTCQWRITGYMSVQDPLASEITLTGLVDAIAAAFDADPTLDGTVQRCGKGEAADAIAGIQCRRIVPVRLLDSLPCHQTRLVLHTQHFA